MATAKIRINSIHDLAPRYFIIIILKTKNDLNILTFFVGLEIFKDKTLRLTNLNIMSFEASHISILTCSIVL